jgi:hypothetical protein
LGKTTFSDVLGGPDNIFDTVAADGFYDYYETRYYAHPGNFEDYGFELNEAGYIPGNADIGLLADVQDQFIDSNYTANDLAKIHGFRASMRFNTYAVSASDINLYDTVRASTGILGVFYTQVNTLKQ